MRAQSMEAHRCHICGMSPSDWLGQCRVAMLRQAPELVTELPWCCVACANG